VILVSGPVGLATPAGVRRVDVETAEQMMAAVDEHLPGTDVFIAAAAVSDYRPVLSATEKIKKTSDSLVLAMSRTIDILATVAARTPRPFVVGFAAETQNVERNALAKLEGKRLDMIAANQVGDGLAFDCEDNALTVYWPGGRRELARAPKRRLADELVAVIAERWADRGAVRDDAASGATSPAPGSAAAR
jgi:phosphopantothenoylcysteine decarboxylase/phosphopantothenate--cysteine ligase